MKIPNSNPFSTNTLVHLKNEDWLNKQRVAGKIAAKTLIMLKGFIEGKTFHSTHAMSQAAEKYILDEGGTPTFKNYKGFPEAVCISVNKQLVHGIPDDTVLNEGDVISFDLGVTYQGAIADTAITCIFGKPKSNRHVELIKATEESLMRGIAAIAVGKRLGVIGNAISKYAKGVNFGLINNYGGHGLDWNTPHAAPFVANKSNENEGIRIQPGLSIAVEPMLVTDSVTTRVSKDGWTVYCDSEMSAHFEHSLFIHEDHVEIMTWKENAETYLSTNKIYFK